MLPAGTGLELAAFQGLCQLPVRAAVRSFSARGAKWRGVPAVARPVVGFFVSNLAGCVARVATHPIDTLRARYAVAIAQHAAAGGLPEHAPTVYECFDALYAADGLRGFWRGVGASALVALSSGITVVAFSELWRLLHRLFGGEETRDADAPDDAAASGGGD